MNNKKVWNALHIPTCNYCYLLVNGDYLDQCDFKTKTKAYWKLINVINAYNEQLGCNQEEDFFSQGQPLTFKEFDIVKTNPISL